MPRSTEQLEQIRKEKKKLIMDVALELFATNGFHATSISQITKKAGISKGLVYNYFESKQEILHEITHTAFAEFYSNFDLNKDGILTKDEFIFFIRESFRLVNANRDFWQLYFALMVQPSIHENFSKEYEEMAHPIMTQIYGFLTANGSEDPDGDLMVLSSMMEGAFLYAVVAPDVFPIEILAEKIINASFRLISKSPDKN